MAKAKQKKPGPPSPSWKPGVLKVQAPAKLRGKRTSLSQLVKDGYDVKIKVRLPGAPPTKVHKNKRERYSDEQWFRELEEFAERSYGLVTENKPIPTPRNRGPLSTTDKGKRKK